MKSKKQSTFGKLYDRLMKVAGLNNNEAMNDFQEKNKVYLSALNAQVKNLFEKYLVMTEGEFVLTEKNGYEYKDPKEAEQFTAQWHKLMKKPIVIYE